MAIVKALFGIEHALRVQNDEFEDDTPTPKRIPSWMRNGSKGSVQVTRKWVTLNVVDDDEDDVSLVVHRRNGSIRHKDTGEQVTGSISGGPDSGHIEISVQSGPVDFYDSVAIRDIETLDHLIEHLVIARTNMICFQLAPIDAGDIEDAEAAEEDAEVGR